MIELEELTPDGEQPKFTPGPMVVNGKEILAQRKHRANGDEFWFTVATVDPTDSREKAGEGESGANARLFAAAPAMYELLKATQAYIETQDNETMPDEMAALWNRIAAALALVDSPQETK